MATCRLYEKQLSSYLDGELGAIRAAHVAAHLNTCPHCRAELDALSGIGHHVRAASSDLRVSNDFDQRVLHSFGYLQVSGRPVRQRTFTKPLLVVAMVLLALLGMVWHYLTEPLRPPQPAAQPASPIVAPAPPVSPALPDGERRAEAGR
jgi:anti-sigma factor RsiW